MGHDSVAAAAVLVAVAAAVRSMWSPCSLSMLSMLTPFGEQSRGNRYPVAAAAFAVAAAVGGACLALPVMGVALAVRSADIGPRATGIVVAAAAFTTIAAELGWLPMPQVPRQVDESWFGRYRSWVYGVGYGWQLGAGLTTYVMTTGVYLTLALAALTASPPVALAVCVWFGTLRGLTILVGARLSDADALRALHDRLERLEPTSRALAVAAQAAAACAGLTAVTPIWVTVLSCAGVIVLGSIAARTMPSRRASTS